jgi:hypothetical protein
MSGASSQLSAFNYAVQPLGNLQIKNISEAYTVSPSDSNFILNCSGATSYIITMPTASSLPSGFNFVVWNNTTTTSMAVTIDPNGSETIDGVATLILQRGEGMQIVCDGKNWQTGNKKVMRLYAENFDRAENRPIASGNTSVAISRLATASGTESVAIGNSATASGSSAFALGVSASASGTWGIALGQSATASSNNSTAIGRNSGSNGSQAVTGQGAMALGGSYASGTDSFAAGVADNTSTYGAQGANSIAIGTQAKATGIASFALDYQAQATATGARAFGYQALASGANSMAIGRNANATGVYSYALGWSKSDIDGKFSYGSGAFSSVGDAQIGIFVLRRATTDATATVLTTNNSALGSTNQVILPNNSAFAFTGTIIARQQAAGGSNYAAWEVKGAILRDATAASTVLGSYNINVLSKTAGASAWDLTLSADTTNGGLAVTATGAASVNIRWVATIKTSEVTYA